VKEGVADVLAMYFPVLNIMSPDVIREVLLDALNMGLEIAKGPEITSLKKNIEYTKRVSDERLVSFYCDIVLACYKLSRLIGFGFASKFGDPIAGNPEHSSYFRIGGSI
jgi:hypothetical protein